MPENYTYTKLDGATFDALATALSPLTIPLEQSPLWGEFEDNLDGRTYLGSFRYDDTDGRMVAVASATLYKQPGRDWIWIKHGPLFASVPNTETIKKMCSTLKQQFTEVDGTHPLFIRISAPTSAPPLVKPFEHTMYDQTIVLDLTQDEDTIWFGMSQSSRQAIKKAEKAGVSIKKLVPSDAAAQFQQSFYPLLAQTAGRSNFGVHPPLVYQTMLENLAAASLYGAYQDNKVVAWAIITNYQQRALYYYGASSQDAHQTGAAYLVQWQVIKDLKAAGVLTYDLMGIAGKHYPSLKSVTDFKMKFSKNVVDVPEAYDLPLQALKYRLLSKAIKLKRIFK